MCFTTKPENIEPLQPNHRGKISFSLIKPFYWRISIYCLSHTPKDYFSLSAFSTTAKGATNPFSTWQHYHNYCYYCCYYDCYSCHCCYIDWFNQHQKLYKITTIAILLAAVTSTVVATINTTAYIDIATTVCIATATTTISVAAATLELLSLILTTTHAKELRLPLLLLIMTLPCILPTSYLESDYASHSSITWCFLTLLTSVLKDAEQPVNMVKYVILNWSEFAGTNWF